MGKALVMPNCDFSANKVTTINFSEVHCTGISIPATLEVKEGLTATLVATLTPSNTTDAVTWSSSDDSVATVSGGVITGIAEGTAVITAVCNGHIATCTVEVSSIKLFAKGGQAIVAVKNNGLVDAANGSQNTASYLNAAFGASYGSLPVFGISTDLEHEWCEKLYPFKLPEGTSQINVECPNFAPIIVYYNSKVASTNVALSTYKVRDAAKVLDGETPASGTDWSISSWTYDARTFSVPDIEGIDSFTLGLHAKNQAAYESFDPSTVQITFS